MEIFLTFREMAQPCQPDQNQVAEENLQVVVPGNAVPTLACWFQGLIRAFRHRSAPGLIWSSFGSCFGAYLGHLNIIGAGIAHEFACLRGILASCTFSSAVAVASLVTVFCELWLRPRREVAYMPQTWYCVSTRVPHSNYHCACLSGALIVAKSIHVLRRLDRFSS